LNDLSDARNPIDSSPTLNEGKSVKDEVSKKVSDTTVTREQVLKACVNTSAALGATGLVIRQVHIFTLLDYVKS